MPENKRTYLTLKDHSVSKDEFQLLHNKELDMLETYPQPKGQKLSEYYKSEDYISHTDKKRNLLELTYHKVREISLKKKLRLINSFQSESKTLLDVGCGTGDFLETALKNNWQITGIEPDENARDIANSKTNNAVHQSDELKELKPHSFDVITLWHVLEHLPDLDMHIALFKSLLKPNGTLVIAVPNFKSYDAAYYKGFWAAFDVPRHLWHFSKTSIVKLFNKEGLSLINTLPMKFDAYYVCLLSEKYKLGFMNPIKALWIGWRSNRKAKHTNEYSSHIYLLSNENS
ncbi:class I SAM-dependent methyltransferase [Winogradskyella bathintestinalis]|uniref:Class I SAM-dependent methyltransferase n=1 Tax=Winogradskyella bathintestinalis TaxID=3035208 RepID=A0ABT7ZR86_9FLAO|nr:class I SAM-dependent methyltransferase [Winogradskyella bathintestinalis]MDN3491523.1 class I SAM-dependent methyltransferase [Winogradskyella bathintestinalis]